MTSADRSEQRRRQSWFGLKRPIKRAVSLPGVNQVAHAVTRNRRGADAAARLPAPMGVHQVLGRIDDITIVMNDPAQCIIAKELYWGGGRRPRAQDQLALEVFARLAQQADHVLDIGSYTGVFSIVAAKVNRAATVDAFEIVPSNFLAAWGNVIANDLVGRVQVHLEGVGEEGSIRMPAATGGSALPDFWSIDDAEAEGGVRVRVSTLERIVSRRAPTPGADILIKVDVEGHENAIVTADAEVGADPDAGADADSSTAVVGAIEAYQPTFLMEILPGAEVAPLLEIFGRPGRRTPAPYRFYLIAEGRLRQAPTLHGDEDCRDWLITTLNPEELTGLGIAVDDLT